MLARKEAFAARAEATELQVLHCADQLLMAMVGPVCIALWQTKPTPALFEIQRTHLNAAVANNPGKVSFMCVVEGKAEPPDEAERKASAAMITSLGADLFGVACVVESQGFRAAITRTVLSGVLFLVRSPAPIKLFDNVPVAAHWLSRCAGSGVPLELPSLVERGRSLLTAQRDLLTR